MSKLKISATNAIRFLKQHKVTFVPHLYPYEEKGGTKASAKALNVDEFSVIKTLVMEDDEQHPFIILMHGSCEVSLKHLARQLKVKQITPCNPDKADRVTGYQTGGISPFGTRQSLPIYMEASIEPLGKIWINGGKRGLLVEISPADLIRTLQPVKVSVAI
ncbi:Cys-tRNA(Pro) deacylase [Pelovirga terrestris]|uniref:Cys-tRNA(Pro)/Cys-tRNA(Cys) deacylase n=1 Tax=Pelovirga terrestris TaxID=2771352 RepID=A0A8J6QP24_9BACT|nr:Cys-tRNA(Pro) deacylase [Pelovirga terrestris]MBD1401377.1 Cys-tRNA(Pro) deacylase [Pelovirga terrestris]